MSLPLEARIHKYALRGARRVRNLVFSANTEPTPCVPHAQILKKPSGIARPGVLKSHVGAIQPKPCAMEPLIVEFTESAHDKHSATVKTELMWVAPVTGSIFTDEGQPLANNSTLYVEWEK